jgi:predicted benzoate:H+ symporter BenE
VRFNPLATAVGVFTAVAIPIIVVGYTRPAGSNSTIIVIGIAAGVLAGLLAGLWVASRGGDVWRGPRM